MENEYRELPDKVLCIGACDIKVCIDVRTVLKVIMLPYLEHSPIKAQGLVGILNYSGHNINVVDLYALLTGNRKKRYSLDNSVVIIGNDEVILGLIVDEIYEVKEIDPNKVEFKVDSKLDELVIGTAIFNDEIFTLLKSDLYNLDQVTQDIKNT